MEPLAELNLISIQKKIPIIVSMELTYRCCFSCKHCYLPQTHKLIEINKESEINLLQISKALKELKKMGAMFLILTGGEPFLRQDLVEVCKLCLKYNFDTKLFTSLYLADIEKLKAIKKAGIKWLEVSLYGGKKIYEKITGVKNSFDKVIENLFIAKDLGFKIKLKTPLMNINSNKILWLRNFCKKNGFNFGVDPNLTPLNNGDKRSLKFKANFKDLKKVFNYSWLKPELNETCLNIKNFPICGAGINTIHIDPYGNVYPCLQLPLKIGNIKTDSILKLWKSQKMEEIRKKLSFYPDKCKNCNLFDFCSRCPGISYVYSKDINYIYEDACYMAGLNKELL